MCDACGARIPDESNDVTSVSCAYVPQQKARWVNGKVELESEEAVEASMKGQGKKREEKPPKRASVCTAAVFRSNANHLACCARFEADDSQYCLKVIDIDFNAVCNGEYWPNVELGLCV